MVCRPAYDRRHDHPLVGKRPIGIIANSITQQVGVTGRV